MIEGQFIKIAQRTLSDLAFIRGCESGLFVPLGLD